MLSVKYLLHGCVMQRSLPEFHNFLFIITAYTPQFTITSLLLIIQVAVNFYKKDSLEGFPHLCTALAAYPGAIWLLASCVSCRDWCLQSTRLSTIQQLHVELGLHWPG